MPETDRRLFLVELDLRGLTSWQLDSVHRALGEAVRLENQRGRQIRYVQRIYAPAEQRCLCLFEAAGADPVRSVNDIAQFPLARILAVLSCVPEETGMAPGLDETGPRPDSDQAAAAGLRARGDAPLGDP